MFFTKQMYFALKDLRWRIFERMPK